MSTIQTSQPTCINVGPARASYANLLVPKAMLNEQGVPTGNPKYSVTLLIPKTDKAAYKAALAAQEAAIALGRSKNKFGEKLPKNFKFAVQDGDEKTDKKGKPIPEYAGMWFINCNSERKPGFVDAQRNVMMNPTDNEIYSGMWIRANVNFFPYDNKSIGISAGLNHVQKLRDGERFGGAPALDTAFDDEFVFQDEDDDDV